MNARAIAKQLQARCKREFADAPDIEVTSVSSSDPRNHPKGSYDFAISIKEVVLDERKQPRHKTTIGYAFVVVPPREEPFVITSGRVPKYVLACALAGR